MGCGCDDNNPGVDYSSLPILTGCPGDEETFLVGNAEGGTGAGKYGRRKWEDIRACLIAASGSYKALSATITDASNDVYQNDELIGATEVAFVIINKQLFTYQDGDFAFNSATGTIAFLTVTIFVDDKIVVPYKAA